MAWGRDTSAWAIGHCTNKQHKYVTHGELLGPLEEAEGVLRSSGLGAVYAVIATACFDRHGCGTAQCYS